MCVIQCPIFHIHGEEDEIIPFKLGKKLYKISKSPFEPWWVKNAGHSDIVVQYPEEYIAKLLEFFAFCEGETGQEGGEGPTQKGGEGPTQKGGEGPTQNGELNEQVQPHQNMEIENSSTEQK